MDKILGLVGGGLPSSTHADDDFSDRLVHHYSSILCIIFAAIVSSAIYVGDPIHCWVPAHFSDNWQEYSNAYCWVQNTYYLPFGEYIPHAHESDKRQIIPYYQWIPFILLSMALMFYLPVMLWRALCPRSGVDLNSLVGAAISAEVADSAKKRKEIFDHMVQQVDRFLTLGKCAQRGKRCALSIKNICARTLCRPCSRNNGNYLSAAYIFVKLVYILDMVLMLFALNFFLGQSFTMYGFEFIRSISRNSSAEAEHGWDESERFPRVTMCDLNVRRLGNVQRYTVQCVLPINLFNEKIFLFLWFWMMAVTLILLASFLRWFMRSVFRVDRLRYVRKHLYFMGILDSKGQPQIPVQIPAQPASHAENMYETSFGASAPPVSPSKEAEAMSIQVDTMPQPSRSALSPFERQERLKKVISRFAQEYLRTDGIFVLRMVGNNTSPVITSQLTYHLFKNYQQKNLPDEKVRSSKAGDDSDDDDDAK